MNEIAQPKQSDVDRYAARIHRCPEGYDGQCWGPTAEDKHTAHSRLVTILNCTQPQSHAPDSPFRYCACGWTEEWGTFEPLAPTEGW